MTIPVPRSLRRLAGRGLSRLVDPTILFSFDRTGYALHSLGFDPADLEVDLAGRRCLVSGANSGIGFEAARALAGLGAEVVLLCRNEVSGAEAVTRIREATGNPRVGLQHLDLESLASVRRAAGRLADGRVDVLVHNAGLLPDRHHLTPDGLETTFSVHVAGPHLLTRLLRPRLEESSDGRVVWVSSGGMYTRKLRLDDPQWERRDYDGVVAYAETKRMQVVLAELWAERLRGTRVVVNSMHPGWASTPGVVKSLPLFERLTKPILRTPAQGADTIVWLAAAERAREHSGRFFFDRQPRRTHFLPFTKEEPEQRHELWSLCEKLTTRVTPLESVS